MPRQRCPVPIPGSPPERGGDGPGRSVAPRRTTGGCRRRRPPKGCRDAPRRPRRPPRDRVGSRWPRRQRDVRPPRRRPGGPPRRGPEGRPRPTTPPGDDGPEGLQRPVFHTAHGILPRHRRPSARGNRPAIAGRRAVASSRRPRLRRAFPRAAAGRRSRRRVPVGGCCRPGQSRWPAAHTRRRPAPHPRHCSLPGPVGHRSGEPSFPTRDCRSRGGRALGARSPSR